MEMTFEEEEALFTELGIDLNKEDQECTEPGLEGLSFSICHRIFPMSEFPTTEESLFHVLDWYQWTTECHLDHNSLAEFSSYEMLEKLGLEEGYELVESETTEAQRSTLDAEEQFLLRLILDEVTLKFDIAFGFVVGQGVVFDHIRSIEGVQQNSIPEGLMESINMYLAERVVESAWSEGPPNVRYW